MPDAPHSLYGIAGRAAAEAVLQHGRDGARLRPAADAFLLSRIGRAVVDALNAEYVLRPRGECADDAFEADVLAWEQAQGEDE